MAQGGVRGLLSALVFLTLASLNLDAIVVMLAAPAPPEAPPTVMAELRSEGEHRSLGPCWWREHHGQHVMYLEGDALQRGYCNARLSAPILPKQQAALDDALNTFLPFLPLQHAVVRGLLFTYRHLPEALSATEKLQLLGVARGRAGVYHSVRETFVRVLYYHAIHEVSQAMVDNPLLACTAFATHGEGGTLLARVFDFEGGRVFDTDKIVVFTKPDYGIPYVSVVWGGMIGVVSGMNSAGIAIVLNAAASDDFETVGTPTTLVVREALQHARSIDDVVATFERHRISVADIFTVADGKTGELAVIEASPRRVVVRREQGRVLATNHLLHPDFAADRSNAERVLESTTGTRLARLEELVEGPLDREAALAVLRDRKGPGGADRPLGHRGTIDALIAAHAVIFEPDTLKLWVSTPPHTLGAFVGYDLGAVMDGRFDDQGTLPSDPLLSGRWSGLAEARAQLKTAQDSAAVRALLQKAPDYPPALKRLAELCEAEGADCAREAWQRYLALPPAHLKNAREAKARLDAL